MAKEKNVPVGTVYNMLTVMSEEPAAVRKGGRKRRRFLCRCLCGTESVYNLDNLGRGTISCGCKRVKDIGDRSRTHGLSKSTLERKLVNMKSRCYNPNNSGYKNYGGKGISVCPEWRESAKVFIDWALANGWEEGLEIDRRDNDGNYCPSNCRFITHAENARNKTTTRRITLNGITKPLKTYCEDLGLDSIRVHDRLSKGWSVEDALLCPKGVRRSVHRKKK